MYIIYIICKYYKISVPIKCAVVEKRFGCTAVKYSCISVFGCLDNPYKSHTSYNIVNLRVWW